jgi:hypothetical protein
MAHEPAHTKDWSLLFTQYRGQWVALADDEVTVVAAASTAKAALATSAAKGVSDPILYRVPDSLDSCKRSATDEEKFIRLASAEVKAAEQPQPALLS